MRKEVRTLVRWRWEILKRSSPWAEAIVYVGLPLGGMIAFFVGWSLGRRLEPLGTVFLWVGLAALYTVLQAVILGGSMAYVLKTMYLDSDLELVMAASVRPGAVFLARLLEVLAFPGLALTLVSLFGVWGVGAGTHMGFLFYPAALLAALFLPMLPAGAAAVLTMVLVRYLPAWRLREMLAVAGSVLWLGYYALQSVLQRSLGNSIWPIVAAWFAGNEALGFFTTSPGPVPANWAAWATIAVGLDRPDRAVVPFLGFAALSVAAFGGVVLVAERLYLSGWASVGVAQRRRRRVRSEFAREARWVLPRVWAIMRKDWLLVRRDLRRMLNLLWPVAYVFAMYSGPRPGASARTISVFVGVDVVWGLQLAMMGFVLFTLVSNFSGGLMALEGKASWILRSAPVSEWEWIMAKFWGGLLPAWLGSGLFLIILVLVGGLGPGGLARGVGVILVQGVGLAALSLVGGSADESRGGSDGLARTMYSVGYLLMVDIILVLPISRYGTPLFGQWGLVLLQSISVVGLTGLIVWVALDEAMRHLKAGDEVA